MASIRSVVCKTDMVISVAYQTPLVGWPMKLHSVEFGFQICKRPLFNVFSLKLELLVMVAFQRLEVGFPVDDKGTVISVADQPLSMRWPTKLDSVQFGFQI